MGKGSGACSSRSALSLEERVNPFTSEVDRLLSRVIAKPGKSRRLEAKDGMELYEQMVDTRAVLPYEIQNKLAIISQDEKQNPNERLKARQALAFYNQRWVIRQAHGSEFKGRGVEIEELINAGNVGLMEAIDQFDPKRDITFLTYAKGKIFMRMQRLTEDTSANLYGARVSSEHYNDVGTVRKAQRELVKVLNRDPDLAELNAYINADREEGKEMSMNRISSALDTMINKPKSMQTTIASEEGDDLEFGHTLASDKLRPDQEVANNQLALIIASAFENLNNQEQEVVGSRLGYGDYQEVKSIAKYAELKGIPESRAKAIWKSGITKLRTQLEAAGLDGATALIGD